MELKLNKAEKSIVIGLLIIPLLLLLAGIYHGLLQTLFRSGMISQESFAAAGYYQGLTIHGVLNAMILTTFFTVAFGHVFMTYYSGKRINPRVGWTSFTLMIIGTLMLIWAMVSGNGSVMYTFLPPLKAHPLFYMGVSLLIIGSWTAFFDWIRMFRLWRLENKESKIPLPILGLLVIFTIWFVGSLPVVWELLVMLLPWSLGFTETINVPAARAMYWFFGSASTYFWLLPVILMYSTILPFLAGGKLYSEKLGKLVFLLFLAFALAGGLNHQYGDPYLLNDAKIIQAILAYAAIIPALLLAFNIAASLEYAAAARGNRGSNILSWIFNQPYFDKKNYLFAYLVVGLILYAFGVMAGIVNNSFYLSGLVQNTAWTTGNLHLTLGGPIFLGILGMSLYLLENVSGRKFRNKRFATIVPHLWLIGTLILSAGMMIGGMRGEPMRANMGISYLDPENPLFRPDWVITSGLTVLGGFIMFLSFLIFLICLIDLMMAKPEKEGSISFPKMEYVVPDNNSRLLNRLGPWIIAMFIFIFIAYTPVVLDTVQLEGPGAHPFHPDDPNPIELFEIK